MGFRRFCLTFFLVLFCLVAGFLIHFIIAKTQQRKVEAQAAHGGHSYPLFPPQPCHPATGHRLAPSVLSIRSRGGVAVPEWLQREAWQHTSAHRNPCKLLLWPILWIQPQRSAGDRQDPRPRSASHPDHQVFGGHEERVKEDCLCHHRHP